MKARYFIVEAVKSVKQKYQPTEEVTELLEDFRCMVNDCIRIGIKEKVTSMKSLSLKAYRQLSNYDIPTRYRLTAISKAAGILRNYRREMKRNQNAKVPYVTKLALTECYAFRIFDHLLRLPIRNGEYVFVVLNKHTQEAISGYTTRSITLTDSSLSIAFSKETAVIEAVGLMGIDRNLDNVTLATSSGVKKFGLSQATQIKQAYREVKSHFKRNDVRIRGRIFRKYGVRERNKVIHLLNLVSKRIVQQAKEQKLGIVMEKLTGIRKLYRRGNGQGANYRARLNGWSYHELQRQIEYKANWEGIPVIYVSARGTSVNCSICGSKTYPNGQRTLFCAKCNISIDRDVNGARNILAKGGLGFSPNGLPSEAMIGERAGVAPILKVDGGKVTQG